MSDAALVLESTAVGFDRVERTRRRSIVSLGVSSALFVALSAGSIAFDAHRLCLAGLLPLIGCGASLVMLAASTSRMRPWMRPGRVAVTRGMLEVRTASDTLRVPLEEVTQGWWEDPDLVHLATRSGELVMVRAHDAAEGDRLLHAAGVSAAERVLRVPLASAAERFPGLPAAAGMALALTFLGVTFGAIVFAIAFRDIALLGLKGQDIGGMILLSLLFAPLVGFGYALVRGLRRREATVGADGVVYRKTFGTELIRYDGVAEVVPDRRGVRVVRSDTTSVLLPTPGAADHPLAMQIAPPGQPPASEAEAARTVLLERIRLSLATYRAGGQAAPSLERLDRRGRPLAAWREELGKLLSSQGGDYRSTVTAEDLGAVIEDAAAPAERRIGAAVALAARAQGEARRRVRIAAQACADEDLRRALEAAAEGEIEDELLERQEREAERLRS